ncbi:MAG: ECF-type sigma factor [Gemmatimonadaceae bacterium]
MSLESSDITRLVRSWAGGDEKALDQIVPILYDRLRQLAHERLRSEADGVSLNTTELVHEAYLKLADTRNPNLQHRSHFLALASRVMRNLLVDRARARLTRKRGSGQIPLEWADLPIPDAKLDVVMELDEALQRLEMLHQRQSQILEQRYFGGLSLEETAEALGVSLATVKRELRSARAWLALELRAEPSL